MTPEFTTELQSRIESLVSGLSYFHKPTGSRIPPRVYKTMLPDMESFVVGQQQKESDVFPVVCWGIDGGELSKMKRHPIQVGLIACITVDETQGTSIEQIVSGSADIEELTMALGGLAGNCFFAGFKLQLPYRFSFGLPGRDGERLQPHPVYMVKFSISFLTP